jgi:FAD/FMN-containing dehydrogenase
VSQDELIEGFRARILERKPLRIRGGGSKDFYGGPLAGELLDTRSHAGIVNYEPTELVVTARAARRWRNWSRRWRHGDSASPASRRTSAPRRWAVPLPPACPGRAARRWAACAISSSA